MLLTLQVAAGAVFAGLVLYYLLTFILVRTRLDGWAKEIVKERPQLIVWTAIPVCLILLGLIFAFEMIASLLLIILTPIAIVAISALSIMYMFRDNEAKFRALAGQWYHLHPAIKGPIKLVLTCAIFVPGFVLVHYFVF